jgi:hypothetical protein
MSEKVFNSPKAMSSPRLFTTPTSNSKLLKEALLSEKIKY